MQGNGDRHGLSEREGIGADAGIEKFDLEGMFRHGPRLPDQLIEPLLPHAAPPCRIDIETVVRPRSLAINPDPETNRGASSGSAQNEVKIAGVKTVGDVA